MTGHAPNIKYIYICVQGIPCYTCPLPLICCPNRYIYWKCPNRSQIDYPTLPRLLIDRRSINCPTLLHLNTPLLVEGKEGPPPPEVQVEIVDTWGLEVYKWGK